VISFESMTNEMRK